MAFLSSAAYEHFFEETIDLSAICRGTAELPPFPGRRDGPWYRLYQIFQAAIQLQKGNPEAAHHCLCQVDLADFPLRTEGLMEIWLSAELGHLENARERIDEIIEGIETGLSSPVHARPAAAYALDFRLCCRWVYLLRFYLTALLPEISPQQLERCQHDLAAARQYGAAEAVLKHLEFLLRIIMARQIRSVDQVLQAVQEWQALCQEQPQYGQGQ